MTKDQQRRGSLAPKTGKLGSDRALRIEQVAEYSGAIRQLLKLFPTARRIEDATHALELNVTTAHVGRANPGNPAYCAVAVAASDDPAVMGAMIGRNSAYLIYRTGLVIRYQLNKAAQVRTAIFDDRGTMTPGYVLLSPPAASQRLGRMKTRLHASEVRQGQKKKPSRSKKWAALIQKRQAQAAGLRQHIVTHGFRTWDRAALSRETLAPPVKA